MSVRNGPPISVLLADHDPDILSVLADVLGDEPGLRVVGTAMSADEVVLRAADMRPDVAVVDARLPGGGPRAARELLAASPTTRVVALSAHDERRFVASMLRAGAISYVVKGAPLDEILEAVTRAAAGRGSLSAAAATAILRELDVEHEVAESGARRVRSLVTEIETAMQPGGIVPVFQPIVDLASRAVAGYEALARFTTGVERRPDLWFETAEEVGLREELELAAIRAALGRFDDLPPDVFLSINASPGTAVSEGLEEALLGLPLGRLELEVTEHAPIADYDALEAGLRPLRVRGLRLAVDDAGAGFASLRHILRLRPDIIKLDISLTRDIDRDQGRRALARALVSYAIEMGLSIVAEGIETEAELETLAGFGVRYGQGYLLGRPGPLPSRPSVRGHRPA